MKDEIYHNMVSNLKKLGYPLEGAFDIETSKEIGPEERLGDEEYSTSSYIEFFSAVSEKILIFTVDLSSNSPATRFIKMLTQDGTMGYKRIEDAVTSLSFFRRVPELKNFIESSCENKGVDPSEAIMIIIPKEKIRQDFSISPMFILHDLAHAVFQNKDAPIINPIMTIFSTLYFDNGGYEFYFDPTIDNSIEEGFYIVRDHLLNDNSILNVEDWTNTIFALALSDRKNYLKFPKTVVISKGREDMGNLKTTVYTRTDECSEREAVNLAEAKVKKICEESISILKGKVLFNML